MAANARTVEVRKGRKAAGGGAAGLQYLVDEMTKGNTILSSFIRDGIDQADVTKNILKLDGDYAKKYNQFKIAYAFSAKNDKGEFEFDGSTYTKDEGSRISNTVENQGGARDRYKYRYLGESNRPIMGKLFKDMAKVTEMGHESLSILIGQMALALKDIQKHNPKDKRIQPLKAMILVCRKIDAKTDEAKMSVRELVELEKDLLTSNWDVGADASAIVDAFKGVKGEVVFTMESQKINQGAKTALSQELGKIFQEIVTNKAPTLFNAAFAGFDISNLQGSPSIAQHIGEQIQNILDPAIRGGARSAKVDPKKKKKTAKPGGASKPRRMKAAGLAPIALTKAKKHVAKTSKISLNNMLGIINTKLPGTVLDNMRAPGLESRTGKFAQSVRVTEVIQTSKGYPSVGYTYQKDPYQVYESSSGTRFSDAKRDPRIVIDQSIREIAATMAMGRLYTRRI
jgi:hypothetical protein